MIEGRWNLANKNWPGSFIVFLALTVVVVTAAAVLCYRMWSGLAISIMVLTGELDSLRESGHSRSAHPRL